MYLVLSMQWYQIMFLPKFHFFIRSTYGFVEVLGGWVHRKKSQLGHHPDFQFFANYLSNISFGPCKLGPSFYLVLFDFNLTFLIIFNCLEPLRTLENLLKSSLYKAPFQFQIRIYISGVKYIERFCPPTVPVDFLSKFNLGTAIYLSTLCQLFSSRSTINPNNLCSHIYTLG